MRGQPGPRLAPEAETHRGRRGGRQEGGGEALEVRQHEHEGTEVASGIVKFSSEDASPTVFFTEFFNISARVIGTFDAVFNRFLTTSFSLLFIH